jgi:hypothetical protein
MDKIQEITRSLLPGFAFYFKIFTSVPDPGSGAFLTLVSGKGKNQDPDPG